ncbi:MAG: DUF4348 domain-containing protein [Phycisphaerae bacterium]|nr:DUF4348 domain-containing protein [Phycisphaerae bacterium]NIX01487.1 DUF4348 domain-containing protein [Phycisphaerae bacterium]NIX31224.1 DUF4348 domain-containing protein [Phycisphaerae bacterium]
MKSIFIVLFLLLMSFVNQFQKSHKGSAENFHHFLVRFSFDETFQRSRIKFPLEKSELSDDYKKTVTVKVDSADWKPVSVIHKEQLYITDIRFSFEEQEEDSDERIFAYIGIENGIDIRYYFKRHKGLWWLVKIADFST